jgi:hypothetical protein
MGTNPRIGQPMRCGSGEEPFFSRAVGPFNSIESYIKGYYVQTV